MLSVWVLVRRWCQTCTCIFQFQDRTVDWNIEVKQLGAGNPRTLIKLFQKFSDSIFWILSLSCLWYNDLDMSVPRKIRINVDAAPRSDGSSIVYGLKVLRETSRWHGTLHNCISVERVRNPPSHVCRMPSITELKHRLSGLAWSRPRADRGLSRPTRLFRTTIGLCGILSRSVEIWQHEG